MPIGSLSALGVQMLLFFIDIGRVFTQPLDDTLQAIVYTVDQASSVS